MRRKVDLHAHTTASDGVLAPEKLVALARKSAVHVLAVTDHDTTDGVAPAIRAAAGTELTVWPGVELSTDVPAGEVHVLGYFLDHENPTLQTTLAEMREGRIARGRGMVDKLTELGHPIRWERVVEIAGDGTLGRPHVAQALIEAGHVATNNEAFDRFLGRNAPAYVERPRFTPAQAVELIKQYGGVPVLAHPTYAVLTDNRSASATDLPGLLDGLIRELVLHGLKGIEVFYSNYSRATVDALLSVARRYGLVPTGGSDYHGREPVSATLGSLPIPWETVTRLERLASVSAS